MDRIKDLGISPVVIRNENTPSEIGVYNQMRPEKMMTKNTLYNVIEANTLTRVEDDATEDEKSLFNHIGAKYLDETLTVYTPEKMSKDLKLMHEKIEDYSKKTGKKPVYYVPNSKDIKSLDYISYSYRKINDMPASSFIPSGRLNAFYKIHSDYDKDNSFVVILDDCALSGGSMRSELAYDSDILKLDSNIPVVFANLKVSTEAMNNFENPSRHPVDIIYIDQINSEPIRSDAFSQVVGDPQYKENAYSLVFPYMAPDNNSQLATNVALLHNSKYNSENFLIVSRTV
jgi:hypothetical protein